MAKVRIGQLNLNVVQRGAGDPVLFVHGFPLDHQMWQGQIDDLATDHTVIAPDLRGFGQSDISPSAESLGCFADDLAGLLDALHVDRPVTLVGLSMGGYVAWQFWQRHRRRLARFVLCDTRAQADSSEVARNRRQTAEVVLRDGPITLAEGMPKQLFSEHTQRTRADLVAATRQVILSTSPLGIAAALRAMAARPDATPWLAEIKIPTLCLCGQEDRITRPSEMETMAAAMPDARLVTIARCGHMTPLEDPLAVNRAIRAFLAATRTMIGS